MAFNFQNVQKNNTTNPFNNGDVRLTGIGVSPSKSSPISDVYAAKNNIFNFSGKNSDARFIA